MKYGDINRRYTEIVAQWLGKGYTINTATMSGTQTEYAKIDLTDGEEIVRVLIEPFSEWVKNEEDESWELTGVQIIAGVVQEQITPNVCGRLTAWNHNLEILELEQFVEIMKNVYEERPFA